MLFVMLFLLLPYNPVKAAPNDTAVPLTAEGERLESHYAEVLNSLSKEIASSLPGMDGAKKEAFLKIRAELDALNAPGEEASPESRKAFEAAKTLADAKATDAARALLGDISAFLKSDTLDTKLMKASILRHGTPRGLAEFAQQGDDHKAMLDKLLADEALMKQILIAGGANGGEYGEAMQVYMAILEASERARERGTIFHRLALGTALQQPWLEGKEKGGIYGIVHADSENPDGQVKRYLHYEKAYLDGELDPAFKDMNTWQCRFITNDPYSNVELSWTREMLRTYRPDIITTDDHQWRYTRFVKSDVPYDSPTWDDALGLKCQQIVAGGGKCGPRAFFGRTLTRAFGIPARRSTQTGHAAMNKWTPKGWVVCFGGWWSVNWCGPQGGLDFLLDSQARDFQDDYMQVLRAQWVGDALGEEDVSIRHYGVGGGFWDGLSHFKKRIIVADAKVQALEAELAALSADEARLLGESDKILGDKPVEKIEIDEKDRKIVIEKDGLIRLPAVACTEPNNNTDKVAFLHSFGGGMQIHYQRLGERPEILRYTVKAPAAGEYRLTALVATVSSGQSAIFRINRRDIVNVDLPYSKGMWQESQPQTITLREGDNTIMLSFRSPNRGVSIKEFQLKPLK